MYSWYFFAFMGRLKGPHLRNYFWPEGTNHRHLNLSGAQIRFTQKKKCQVDKENPSITGQPGQVNQSFFFFDEILS